MPTLLRIDASSRTEGSHSRELGDRAEQNWLKANPTGRVVTRDVSTTEIPPISAQTITGFYTPADSMTPDLLAATALSDQLIEELQSADYLLITTPMYNFGVPAGLKAWIDQITRIGHSFSYEDGAFQGLLQVPQALVVCAYGAEGYGAGGAMASADFLRPYLQFLLGFLGIDDVKFATVQATTAAEDVVSAHMAEALALVDKQSPVHAA